MVVGLSALRHFVGGEEALEVGVEVNRGSTLLRGRVHWWLLKVLLWVVLFT